MLLINLEDAAHLLGIPSDVLIQLISRTHSITVQDEWGAPCISFDDLHRLHDDPLVIAEVGKAFRIESERRLQDSKSGANERFARAIQATLTEYKSHIALLANLHAKYLTKIRPVSEKTPLMAGYLLYARVINLMNMGCACLEAGYWNSGMILRQIDEAIQVAEYFCTCELTPKLQRDVQKWFCDNRTPQPADIRKALGARAVQDLGESEAKRHLYVMNALYEKKSKWIHPAYSTIRETWRTSFLGDEASITGFDYGPCTYPRRLHELTLFYRSGIWTAIQGFVICFDCQLPLDPDDAEQLYALDRKFISEPDGL